MQRVIWSIQRASKSTTTGRDPRDVPIPLKLTYTNVQDAEQRTTELKTILKVRVPNTITLYRPEAWLQFLISLNLIHKYAYILNGFHFRPIPGPVKVIDPSAYSDASSDTAITI